MANIVHAKNVTIADWAGVVTVGNSTGGTTTDQASNLARPVDWNSQHNFTLSASDIGSFFAASDGLTVSTNTNGVTYGENTVGFYEPFPLALTNTTAFAPVAGSWYFYPIGIPEGAPTGRLGVFRTNASTQIQNILTGGNVTASVTGSITKYHTASQNFAIYSQGTGASSTALYSVWAGNAQTLLSLEGRLTSSNTAAGTTSNTISQYGTISIITAIGSDGGATYGTFTASGTSTTAATSSSYAMPFVTGFSTLQSYIGGSFFDGPGFNSSLSPGNYVFGFMTSVSTNTSGTNYGNIGGSGGVYVTYPVMLELNSQSAYKKYGASISNSSTNPQVWHGYLATTTSAATSKIATSDLRATSNNNRLYFNIAQYFG